MKLWLKLLPSWTFWNLKALLLAPYLATQWEMQNGWLDNANSTGFGRRLKARWVMYDTFDNSLEGDAAWQHMDPGHWEWRVKLASWPALQAYMGRVGWLLRNPAYGYERSVLRANIPFEAVPEVKGDPWIKDGSQGKEGVCVVTIGEYWSYNKIKRLWFMPTRCFKAELGWKLKTYAEMPSRVNTEPFAQYAVTIGFRKFGERE